MAIMQKLWGYLLIVLAAVGALFGVYIAGRKVGSTVATGEAVTKAAAEDNARSVTAIAEAKQVNDTENVKVDKANETLNSVNALPDGDAATKLHDKWSRD